MRITKRRVPFVVVAAATGGLAAFLLIAGVRGARNPPDTASSVIAVLFVVVGAGSAICAAPAFLSSFLPDLDALPETPYRRRLFGACVPAALPWLLLAAVFAGVF